MKKGLRKVFGSLVLVFFAASVYAVVPTVTINSHADGQIIVSSFTLDGQLTVAAVNASTVTYYYKKLTDTAWTVIVTTTGASFNYPWTTAYLVNNTAYQLKAVATGSTAAETFTSPIIGFQSKQSPVVNTYALYSDSGTIAGGTWIPGTAVPNDLNGNPITNARTLWMAVVYGDANGNNLTNATSMAPTAPTIIITPAGKAALTPTGWGWFTLNASSDVYIAKIDISVTTGDGIANVVVAGAADLLGNVPGTATTAFTIDTVAPSIVQVQVDEDGDTPAVFTDNNSYVQNAERPRVYVTFSEAIGAVGLSSFTPAGMNQLAATEEGFLTTANAADATQKIRRLRFNAPISNITGDGVCTLAISSKAADLAGNLMAADYTNASIFTIDGTAPTAPVITLPAEGAAVINGSSITVTLQNPTETDLDYASFSPDGGATVYKDYTSPYSYVISLAPAFAGAITATYTDKAGNTSGVATVNLTQTALVPVFASPASGVTVYGASKITVALQDPSALATEIDHAQIWIDLDDDGAVDAGETTQNALAKPYSVALNIPPTVSGSIGARFVDKLGNNSAVTRLTITPVALVPAIDATAPVAGSYVDPNQIVNVTLTTPAPALYTQIARAQFSADGFATQVNDATIPYSVDMQLPSTFAGVISVRYRDNDNNVSATKTVTLNVNPLVDKTAPRAKITTLTGYPVVAVTVASDDLAANIQTVSFQYSTDGITWVTTGTWTTAGIWTALTWDTSGLAAGTYFVRAIATDILNNTDASPASTTIKIADKSSEITDSTVAIDPTFDLRANIDNVNNTVIITANSATQPTLSVALTNQAGQVSYVVGTVATGAAGAWTATASADFIKNGGFGTITATAKSATTGEIVTKSCDIFTATIDNTIGLGATATGGTWGLTLTVPAHALQQNAKLLVNAIPTPSTQTINGLTAVGQTYHLSFDDGTDNFATAVTVSFAYPEVNASATGLVDGTNIEEAKLIVC
ncbi:MAG: hypothetical protein Q7K21_05810, partial [Elusimicrobiota bacterium]|nr:hypothetical protein [Elusimicrobiota bacterium]